MRSDSDYKDMEDTIQYILALNMECEMIISNDKRFVAKEIGVVTAKYFFNKQDLGIIK